MSMIPYDLVVESIIRDGLEDIKANPTILDDVFGNLSSNYATRKYGAAEIQKIKTLLTGANPTTLAVVHSFHEATAKTPSVAIQLADGREDIQLAHLSDFEDEVDEPLTAAELAALVKVASLVPTAYNPLTGQVSVLDSVDLSNVSNQFIFQDGSSLEHVILPGISDVVGNKFFFIAKQSTVDILNPGLIKSFLTDRQKEVRGVFDRIQILLAITTKEALLTKYLFTLIQFFLLSRKEDLTARGLIVSSFSYSDFTRDEQYKGDMVFVRFLTLSGVVNHTWDSTMFNLIDSVTIDGTPVDC